MTTPAAAGLTSAEAARRLSASGPNSVTQRGRVSPLSSVGAQLRDPLVLVLLAACALTLLTGDVADTAVIALVVVVNTTVGVVQELKADRAITALAQLTTPTVRVRRDQREVSVPAVGLVPGDVLLLGEGDVVPADCTALEASSLLIDESALTGESVAVAKAVADRLAAGTVVAKGRAVAQVEVTGADSALGRIAALMDTGVQVTPLQRRLAELGRTLALVAVALCSLVLVLGLLRGQSLELMVITAISLAVAAVPESLPAVVTFSLALGARRMASRQAVVRHLSAVETLGSVTVLATDKTGTLTESRMQVERLWTPRRTLAVDGVGCEPGRRLTDRPGTADAPDAPGTDPATEPDVVELLRAVALCNDATLVPPVGPEAAWTGLGDPTEVALLVAARTSWPSADGLAARFPRRDEHPFESQQQLMSTVHEDREQPGVRLVLSKGSPEALRRRYGDGSAAWDLAAQRADGWSSQGMRVLAVTAGRVDEDHSWEDVPQHLLGLVAMVDPVKPAARSTVAACRAAGIELVLITGDHPLTARSVAEQVGILDEGGLGEGGLGEGGHPTGRSVVTGPQIADGEVPDLTAPRVFARATPAQKLDIVTAWQGLGAVVAMTGDGVNDGPALHRAHIGVAMGHRGTEVARQAADLVLADDDLASLVVAVEEGRRVYANIRRFLVFGLSGGAAEILVMLVGPFVGLAVPLMAGQILWINLLTHGLTGVAMGAEPADAAQMTRPPRPPDQSVLGDGLWRRVLVLGALLAAVAIGVGAWGQATDRAWQSMLFVSLTGLQLGVALGLRPRQLTTKNPLLLVAVAGSLLLAVAGLYLPPLRDLLGLHGLPPTDLLTAVGVATVGWLGARLTRPRRAEVPGRAR